ncbi:hypothetical protein [Aureibaculum conchae]|uniref:hypothetical protein n=1 Tax=Aureibaculum sp. 2308TA14-22 TaxID=3108392 RepID=UPI003390E397
MNKLILLFVITLFSSNLVTAQETKKSIKDYVNTEISIENNWAGESLTLVKEKDTYFVIRKIKGSGVEVVKTLKYAVDFKSDYRVEFSEVVEPKDTKTDNEKFSIMVEGNEISVTLNGLSVVTKVK